VTPHAAATPKPAHAAPVAFEHRAIEATPAATIREIVDIDDLGFAHARGDERQGPDGVR